MVFAALVGGIVGARLWWIAENGGDARLVLAAPASSSTAARSAARSPSSPGRWTAALRPAAARRRRAVPLAAGYAIGRIGCQLAGDGDYGIAWDGPWAMAYPNGTVPTTAKVHPTPVYETIAMGIVALLLWRWRHRWRPGRCSRCTCRRRLERFLVEFVRRNDDVFAGLTQPQLLSVAMMVARRRLARRSRRRAAPRRRDR